MVIEDGGSSASGFIKTFKWNFTSAGDKAVAIECTVQRIQEDLAYLIFRDVQVNLGEAHSVALGTIEKVGDGTHIASILIKADAVHILGVHLESAFQFRDIP